MGVVKLFPNRYSYKKLGTHYLCDNMKKTGTYFGNFDFKIFGKFLKLYIWPTTVELSGQTDLL